MGPLRTLRENDIYKSYVLNVHFEESEWSLKTSNNQNIDFIITLDL